MAAPRIAPNEEAPEPREIPLYNDPNAYTRTRTWWNRCIDARGLEIVRDPSGDFAPGARFCWEDFLGAGRGDFGPQTPALDEWTPGLVLRDKLNREYVLADDRYFRRIK